MQIAVFFQTKIPASIKAKTALFQKAVARGLGKRAKKTGETSLVITDDREIKKINRRFLGKNRITDVIAFNYAPPKMPLKCPHSPELPFGDIFVSAERADKQAETLKHSLLKELLLLSVHGALHLAGMEDDTPAKRLEMQKKSESILKKLFTGKSPL